MRSCASWAEGSRITANRFKGVFFFENDATPREFSFDPVVPRWHDLIMITGASRHYSLDPLRKVNSQGNQLLVPTSDETQLLRGSEVRYRRLFESAKDGILILDAETGLVVDVNPFLTASLGYLPGRNRKQESPDFPGRRVSPHTGRRWVDVYY